MLLSNIVSIGLHLGKLSQNKKGKLFIETQCSFISPSFTCYDSAYFTFCRGNEVASM